MTYSERKCWSPSRIPKWQCGRTPQGGPGGPLSSTSCLVPECQGEVRSIMPCPDSPTLKNIYPAHIHFGVCFCVVFIDYNWRRKWQPTPVFLPGESQGQGSLVGSHRGGHDWSDLAEAAAALTIIYLQKNAHHVSELYSCCFMSFVNLCLYVLIVFHCMTISQYMNSFCWWIFFFPVDGFLCHFQFGLLCIGWLYPCVLGHICTHFYFIRMVFLVARFTYVWL